MTALTRDFSPYHQFLLEGFVHKTSLLSLALVRLSQVFLLWHIFQKCWFWVSFQLYSWIVKIRELRAQFVCPELPSQSCSHHYPVHIPRTKLSEVLCLELMLSSYPSHFIFTYHCLCITRQFPFLPVLHPHTFPLSDLQYSATSGSQESPWSPCLTEGSPSPFSWTQIIVHFAHIAAIRCLNYPVWSSLVLEQPVM